VVKVSSNEAALHTPGRAADLVIPKNQKPKQITTAEMPQATDCMVQTGGENGHDDGTPQTEDKGGAKKKKNLRQNRPMTEHQKSAMHSTR